MLGVEKWLVNPIANVEGETGHPRFSMYSSGP